MQTDPIDVNPASEKSRKEYVPSPVFREEHAEGTLARLIEQQAAKLPSDFFLFTALAAMGASLAFELAGKTRVSRFVGLWPPALLTMGMYNKLVKVLGPR
jgi:hypothetical protein